MKRFSICAYNKISNDYGTIEITASNEMAAMQLFKSVYRNFQFAGKIGCVGMV